MEFWVSDHTFIFFNVYVFKISVYFPSSIAAKESACNAGDPSSIPGSGRSPGEGLGYPLQYSWASLVAQLVKNLPAMQETWVWSLGWEDPLDKGTVTHSSVLAWRIPWTVACGVVLKSWTRLSLWVLLVFHRSDAKHTLGRQNIL